MMTTLELFQLMQHGLFNFPLNVVTEAHLLSRVEALYPNAYAAHTQSADYAAQVRALEAATTAERRADVIHSVIMSILRDPSLGLHDCMRDALQILEADPILEDSA